ncbi:putative membrane protein [Metabacillus sp. SLBN-84]
MQFRKLIPRATLVLIAAIIIVLTALLPIGHRVLAEEKGGVTELSLYQRASELTREFATALAPGSNVEKMHMLEKNSDSGLLVAGNAGGLLGYAEILSDDTGIVGWLMNSYTSASATITYDQLMHVVDNGGANNVYAAGLNNPFFQYAGYGEVLTEMGLVSTVRPGLGEMMRVLSSGLMLLVYLLANAAPFLFRGALMILTTLNPFKLFETAMNGTASANLGILSGVAEYVGSMYEAVQEFSILFLFPMLLAVTAFSVLVFRKGSAMKKFARYGVRVFMLFAGLPLIGATYTGLIEDLDSKVSVGSEYADYLVLSSYVDFENWVKYSRLAPPADSDIRNPRYEEDEKRSLSDRSLILEVNGTRANNDRAEALKARYASTSEIDRIFDEGGTRKDVDTEEMTAGEKSSFSSVYSILSRHMTSAKYTSSDYDGEVSGQIQRIRSANRSAENDENIVKMFTLSASENRTWSEQLNPFDGDEDWMKPIHWNGEDNNVDSSAKGLFTEGPAKNALFQFGAYGMNIYNSGDLRYNAGEGYVAPSMPAVVESKTAPIGADRAATVGGLSPIAMYNFLNTTFSNTGLTVFSPKKTSSDLSRDAYAAVTFGGSGISSVTRWFENITVMLSLAVLSIAYGVMMVSVAIKSIPRILSGVFGTALGSIAFTTKLLISTAVLIIQIIGMIFLYSLSENIIMTMLLNFNEVVDTGGEYFGAGVIMEFLGSFMVIVITAALTLFMIKNVKVFKEMMEEVVTNSITRVMGALDTGTGGQGLDVSNMSGGRIGGDGKLTQAAKDADNAGLLGGAAGLLGAAHGLEAKREALAEERGMEGRSLGEKIKSRMDTAKDLAKAKGKDVAKGALGIDGKSYDREMEAKEAAVQAMRYGDATALGKVSTDGFTENDDIPANTTETGQKVDENGNVIKDADGHALDADGNAISPMVPLAMAGAKPVVGADGVLTDKDGNAYTDENGQAFYQNSKGQLVNENGDFVALDKDGTLQPVASIPGHNGKPVSAAKAAKALDELRFDSGQYEAMKNEQDATHYGLDKDGQVVGADGQALQMNGANGLVPVGLDNQGFVTGADGSRVSANDVVGPVDERGFEKVEDPAIGETHLRHMGDSAMKNAVLPVPLPGKGKSGSQNLTALAKQANRTNDLAKRADARVEELKASGASPYAIMQAERYANKMNKNANVAQQAFTQAMAANPNGKPATGVPRQPVTSDHVKSAARHANAEKEVLGESMAKLEQMKTDGLPPAMIARQERKVAAQAASAQQAATMEQDLRTANAAGRSQNEVSTARSRVESAEQVYQNAQAAHAAAIASGQPKNVVQKREQRMNQAARILSDAQTNMSRVSQKPSGTAEEIDRATAQHEQAQVRHEEAANRVQTLTHSTAPVPKQEMRQARQEQVKAKQQLDQASRVKQRVLNPAGWRDGKQAAPKVQAVPKQSATKSYAELASAGISNYDDYRDQITRRATDLKANQSKLRQAEQRLATLKASKRPPQIIASAESQVTALESTVKTSQDAVKKLKDNAQGLLKNGNFQPVVASRPLRTNGTAIINQMVHMGHTQAMYDKLAYQEKAGTITEAGRTQMKTLSGRLTHMKRDLVRSGIREDALSDRAGIIQSTKQMQQSWDSFVDGSTVENSEE